MMCVCAAGVSSRNSSDYTAGGKLVVKPAGKKGDGLFTKVEIPKSAFVIEYGAKLRTYKEGEAMDKALEADEDAPCHLFFAKHAKLW